ncbi:F0F1 ATP synthase subunit C [Bacillus sp. E214]|uniref:F0F1 ATP synthase subunit C n=1 Tax=Bacillus sp. E214 TaxID=2587156 RepID=UPI0011E01688|nr:F0F1 ATP synthase subunit C [Bacillus sp. E214]
MEALYYFVLAAVIATFGISWAVRTAIKELVNGPERKVNIQTKMFIKVAVVEAIPIILIIFGFINLSSSTSDVILPLIIVGAVTILNIIFIYGTSSEITNDLNTPGDLKLAIKTLTMMGVTLVLAIPTIAVVACFTVMNS